MEQRYIKNIDEIFSEELQQVLLTKTIAIIGCGAQGGYIGEFLARLGVKSILLWDGDIIERSNLNRQIISLENNIGENKTLVLSQRIFAINSSIEVIEHPWFFGEKESDLIELFTVDCIFIAFDESYDIQQTRWLVKKAIIQGIPAIECPVGLLGGFVSINTYKDLSHYDTFTELLIQFKNQPKAGCQAYKCAIVAGEAVNCMVEYFNQSKFAPTDSVLDINIYHHKYIWSDKYSQIHGG